jgi:glycosyltransferase involved in cell wall biosynthesis
LLFRAVEIICFSHATISLMQRAFPELDRQRLTYRPHQNLPVSVGPLGANDRAKALGRRLTIGVIGTIDRHKGAELVAALGVLITRQHLDIKIVVIGTLAVEAPDQAVTVTGPYAVDHLPDLLRQYEVNVCLLPSIWPETFSYVAQEIMVMGYPLAVFDLGAPAERVATYPLGLVMTDLHPDSVLAHLRQFHTDLGRQTATELGEPVL